MKLKQYIQNPLSLRFPLFDPERARWPGWIRSRGACGPLGPLLWLAVVVGWALSLAGSALG